MEDNQNLLPKIIVCVNYVSKQW